MVLNEIVERVHKNQFSRWNGSWKLYTKNCEGCPSYERLTGEERCNIGVAWKRLYRDLTKSLRKCQYRNKSLEEIHEKG